MIVAVDVVVIAGELGLSLYLIISVSTYAGVREQRARGRNVSDPNAASGQILARLHVLGNAQGTAVGGIYCPIRIASAAAAAAADASAFSLPTANHRLSQDSPE